MLDPSTQHPAYAAHQHEVQQTYDAFYGNVRKDSYVPRLSEQTQSEWEAYVNRAPYFNATERTLQSVIGAMTRNPYTLSQEPATTSLSFGAFLQDLIMDQLLGGRVLLYVDVEDGAPYLDYVASENILNWCEHFVVLATEVMVPDTKNPYKQVPKQVWKELLIADPALYPELHAGLEPGVFYARYWEKVGKQFKITDVRELIINGQPLRDMLPVWWITPYDNTSLIYNPPLLAIAELNIAHFRLNTDLYHGLHFLGLPTFTVVGDLQRDENGAVNSRIQIGSTKQALHLASGGNAFYASFGGDGLGALNQEKAELERQMATLGAQLLQSKGGVETAEALTIRAASQTSTLETMTNALEAGLQAALTFMSMIDDQPYELRLNKNFTDNLADTPAPEKTDMPAVLTFLQKGIMSPADALAEAKRRGIVATEVTAQPVSSEVQPDTTRASL